MKCEYCGLDENETAHKFLYDHFIPKSKGGKDTKDNLVYCCPWCNAKKSDYLFENIEHFKIYMRNSALQSLFSIKKQVERHIKREFESGKGKKTI